MERLEAALEKARASRKALKSGVGGPAANAVQTPAAGARAMPGSVDEAWLALGEFKISNIHARRYRITAMAPGKDAAPYDLLRSRGLRLMREHGWKSVAVTSPNPDCGKSTVSTNLALSIARQQEMRVMLLDLDFRRPALHNVMGVRPDASFHEVLEGKESPDDNLVRYGENLIVGVNNAPCERPSELLQSAQSRQNLDALIAKYRPDITIFDLPPMMASDDNVGFLPYADCALIVSAAESTTVPQLDATEKEVAGLTNVLGVVLNKCRFTDSESGYGQDYY